MVRGRRAERRSDGGAACIHARDLGRGEPAPPPGAGDLERRFDRAAREFERLARRIRDSGSWDVAFGDVLCEPPRSFTYGGVLAHVLSYGAVRREALGSVLAELGADLPGSGEPIEWEAERARRRRREGNQSCGQRVPRLSS